jgi:hypothetical protein
VNRGNAAELADVIEVPLGHLVDVAVCGAQHRSAIGILQRYDVRQRVL